MISSDVPVAATTQRDAEQGGDNEPSLIALLALLLRRRTTLVWSAIICATLFTGTALLRDRTWSTSVSFFPQGKKMGGNLSALAAQFGVGVPTGDANESPSFYADLVKSRAILAAVVDSGVVVDPKQGRVDIADAYKIKSKNPALRRDMAIKALSQAVTISTNAKTGVVSLKVSSRSAPLSAAIAQQLLDLLNSFNQDTRRGQASAEREFTEKRLEVVRKELREAEDALARFLQSNRVATSAALQAEETRLKGETSMQRELYTNLAKSYEQAKIDEVRDTPVITVVEKPEMAARPDPRGIAMKGLASLFAGLVLGALLAFVLEGFSSQSEARSPAQEEFNRLGAATLRDLRRPWRLLRPIRS